MTLPEAAVNEFQKIFQKKFGGALEYGIAETMATNFLSLTALLIEGPNKTKND